MPIDARLLDILCCPSCRSAVRPLADGTGLECIACRRVYPIVAGTPVMLVEESRPPGS